MQKRYSKKRQAIIELLKSTKEHPSAEWVYGKLKPQFPDLSLATVYRNLNELKNSGEITSVAVVCDKERYDYNTSSHTHAICSVCGKVIDIDEVTLPESVVIDAQNISGFTVSYSKLQLVGVCEDCKNNKD